MNDQPKILTTASEGDRVRIQVYMQVPKSRGSSGPLQVPWTLPGTVIDVNDDKLDRNGYESRPEYVTVEIDDNLYNSERPYPFNRRQLAIISRNELHAEDCRCEKCF